jgi:hypothetical protein
LHETNKHTYNKNNHANSLEGTTILTLRIIMLISQTRRETEVIKLQTLLYSFLLNPQSIVATDQAKFAKTN